MTNVTLQSDPVLHALANAPLDDKVLTADEEMRAAEGRAAVARGDVVDTVELSRQLGL